MIHRMEPSESFAGSKNLHKSVYSCLELVRISWDFPAGAHSRQTDPTSRAMLLPVGGALPVLDMPTHSACKRVKNRTFIFFDRRTVTQYITKVHHEVALAGNMCFTDVMYLQPSLGATPTGGI